MRNLFGIAISPLLATSVVLLSDPSNALAQTTTSMQACDLSAGIIVDRTKPLDLGGVLFNDINPALAVPACAAAVNIEPNNAKLQFQYGRALHARNDMKRALEAYKRAHDLGSLFATNGVGLILQYGYKDSRQALQWYEKAAGQGLRAAMKNAANLLEQGEGLPSPDLQRAANYWRALAASGDAESAEKLRLSGFDNKVASRTGPTPNQVGAAVGTLAVVGGIACWAWADKCKELAWEATKEAVKQGIRQSISK